MLNFERVICSKCSFFKHSKADIRAVLYTSFAVHCHLLMLYIFKMCYYFYLFVPSLFLFLSPSSSISPSLYIYNIWFFVFLSIYQYHKNIKTLFTESRLLIFKKIKIKLQCPWKLLYNISRNLARKTMSCVCANNDMHVEMILTLSDKGSFVGKNLYFSNLLILLDIQKHFS